MSYVYKRTLPRLTDENRFYWTSGQDGVMRMQRCGDCGFWIHPTMPVCPSCYSRNVAPDVLSGKGEVFSYTLNVKPWGPGMKTPYAIAVVRLAEQDKLQLTTNIVNCPPEDVKIGMPVKVVFEQDEDIWLPMFEPA